MKKKAKPKKKVAALKALGKSRAQYEKLEVFPRPAGVGEVTCVSDEVTALCPVTGQPDWYTVTIRYLPNEVCAESKTVKLFLQKYRQDGHFCEKFSSIIAEEFYKALKPHFIEVTVDQKPRGGVGIRSVACLPEPEDVNLPPIV